MKLTADNLPDYVRQRGLLHTVTGCEALAGGVACGVWKLTGDGDRALVIKQADELFRVREHWRVDPDRNALEAAVQQLARRQLGPDHVPAVLDVDTANHAYAMEAAPPDARPWKSLLLTGRVDPSLGRQCRQLLEAFHRLRSDELPAQVADPRFFYQQRIEPYFEFTARRHPMVAGLIPWLRQPVGVTHGDFTPKNMLVAGPRIMLLDYEVTHLGQPEFDYASLVNHLTLKWIHLPAQRAALAETIRAFLGERPIHGRLVGALLLARVDGKSPVEYLTGDEPVTVRRLGRYLAETGGPMSAGEFLRIVRDLAGAS